MMETVDINSTPTTPQKGEAQNNEVPKQDDVILSDAPGSDAPNGTLRGEEKFHDPSTSLPPPAAAQEVERAPTPPPLRPTGTTVDDGKTFAEKLIESQFVQSTLELEVTQKLFKTYDGVAEKFGAPNVEKIGSDIMEVHDQWKGEGIVAATKTATTKYIGHTKSVAGTTYEKTKQATNDSWQKVSETTANLKNKGLETAKPYLDRVAENPQVDRVVGTVRSASVGAGSMVTTIAASVSEQTKQNLDTAQKKFDTLRGYTPEYAAKQASEEEAWRQVLKGGSGGEELQVPARQELTTSHFVKAGSVLTWRFRVQSHDIGFAVRLRVQGDGGSTEVDVFANQKYSSGVTVQGEWSPSTDSALIIVWDNSYSYLTSKVVAFQSGVKTMENHIAEQQQEETRKRAEEEAREKAALAAASAASGGGGSAAEVSSLEEAVEETLVFNNEEEEGSTDNAPVDAPVDSSSTSSTTPVGEPEEQEEAATKTATAEDETKPPLAMEEEVSEPVEEKEKDADY